MRCLRCPPVEQLDLICELGGEGYVTGPGWGVRAVIPGEGWRVTVAGPRLPGIRRGVCASLTGSVGVGGMGHGFSADRRDRQGRPAGTWHGAGGAGAGGGGGSGRRQPGRGGSHNAQVSGVAGGQDGPVAGGEHPGRGGCGGCVGGRRQWRHSARAGPAGAFGGGRAGPAVAAGVISTVAGGPGGPARATRVSLSPYQGVGEGIQYPCGLAYGAGSVYIADGYTVRKVNPATDWLTTPAGPAPPGRSAMVAWRSGRA